MQQVLKHILRLLWRHYAHTLVHSAVDAGVVNKANQLVTARKIKLTGDVTGEASFNGSADATITATVADSSHNHAASNITSGTLSADRLPAASTSAKGAVQLNDATNSTSTTQANSKCC